jgi:hypothetical protein
MKTEAQNVVIVTTTATGEEAHTIANILLFRMDS